MNRFNHSLLALGVIAAVPALADGPQLSGFVDAQWVLNAKGSKTASVHGFQIGDAGLYATQSLEKSSVNIDLAFQSAANGAGIDFATEKSQVYLEIATSEATTWTLGIFDTIYGYDAADSAARFFAGTSAVSTLLPNTLTGAMLTSSWGPTTLKVQIANRADFTAPSNQDSVPHFGVQLTYAPEASPLALTAGYLVGNDDVASSTVGLVNAYASYALSESQLSVLEFSFGHATLDDQQWGLTLTHTADLTNKLALGVRGEYLVNDDSNNATDDLLYAATLGLKYSMTETLATRVEGMWTGKKISKNATVDGDLATKASVVYSF